MPKVAVGDLIRGKYELMNSVGSGAYSNVYRCKDTSSMEEKAIKVIDDQSAWEVEVSFLRKLGEGKSEDRRFLMCHLEDFKWRKNYFIVMPLYKMSLFDFWDTDVAVFFVEHIKDIAYQLLSAVAYLHSLEIVHTDIKMENILLENVDEINDVINGEPKKALKNTKIVLCDFDKARILKKGESVNDGKLVQTQCVRAPEVILGLPWNELIDEWSVGVLLVELIVHEQIFGVDEAIFDQPTEEERLKMMEEIWKQTDYTPLSMLKESRFKIFRMMKRIPVGVMPPGWKLRDDPKRKIHFDPELIALCSLLLTTYPPCRISAGAAVRLPSLDRSRSRLENPDLV